MTTERLYYADSYTTSFAAEIVETLTHDGRPAVILDRSCFYPTGGGQPHDTGTLAQAAKVDVLDVLTRAEDKAVIHVLNAPLALGPVSCQIDRARRRDHMQQHTGQHMLSQAFVHLWRANTVGFHLGDTVTIDLDHPDIAQAEVQAAESLVNQVIYDNLPVKAYLVDAKDAEALGVRMRGVPELLSTGGLRVVEIEAFDKTACGGTHVKATGEVGMVKVLRTEKYKGGTRVEFVCGGRALAAFRVRNDVANALTAALTCALSELPAQVERMQEDVRAKDKTLKAMQEQLIEYEARDLLAQALSHDGARLVVAVFADRDAGALRLMAARLTRQPGVIALLGLAGDKTHVICARSADLPHDMNAILKRALEPLGGRGGGQPALAQGGGGAATADHLRAALTRALQPDTTR